MEFSQPSHPPRDRSQPRATKKKIISIPKLSQSCEIFQIERLGKSTTSAGKSSRDKENIYPVSFRRNSQPPETHIDLAETPRIPPRHVKWIILPAGVIRKMRNIREWAFGENPPYLRNWTIAKPKILRESMNYKTDSAKPGNSPITRDGAK